MGTGEEEEEENDHDSGAAIAAWLMPPPLLLIPRRRRAPVEKLELQLDGHKLVLAESPLARRAAAEAAARSRRIEEESRIVNLFSERVRERVKRKEEAALARARFFLDDHETTSALSPLCLLIYFFSPAGALRFLSLSL